MKFLLFEFVEGTDSSKKLIVILKREKKEFICVFYTYKLKTLII